MLNIRTTHNFKLPNNLIIKRNCYLDVFRSETNLVFFFPENPCSPLDSATQKPYNPCGVGTCIIKPTQDGYFCNCSYGYKDMDGTCKGIQERQAFQPMKVFVLLVWRCLQLFLVLCLTVHQASRHKLRLLDDASILNYVHNL